ncbi:TRAP transporter small permease subunit [Lacimonas salitolerans]|uniref:TRAP transporter small permease protein n=1 Tax=Lacimonas salitolerans TaxID=1323750 RepID=A0ABW4ECZ0_9RHOB
MADTTLATLRSLNRWVAIVIGIGLLACVGFILLDIVLRQVGASFGGTDEVSGYVMAIATSWGMGYALLELGHVRIDILRGRAPARGRALFDLLSLLVLSATITLIAFRAWPVVERSLNNGSRANTPLETPLALVQLPWFGGWVWFAIVAWLTFICALVLVARGQFDKSEAAIGCFSEAETVQ